VTATSWATLVAAHLSRFLRTRDADAGDPHNVAAPLTTGVMLQTTKNIVVGSCCHLMVEFKQIIGRGTPRP